MSITFQTGGYQGLEHVLVTCPLSLSEMLSEYSYNVQYFMRTACKVRRGNVSATCTSILKTLPCMYVCDITSNG